MKRGGWYTVAALGLVVAGVVIAWRGWPRTSAGQFDPVGAVTGLASLGVSVIALRFAAQAQRQADSDVASIAARLAGRVDKVETEARRQLLGGHDRVIDLQFNFQAAPAHNADGSAKKGSLGHVVDYYRRLKPQRLVITGAPGSGKTVLAVELVLGLLKDRVPDEPVPVRLSAAVLDTACSQESAVAHWLTTHLMETYLLSAAEAATVVDTRMVLPIIDGLDEMDAADRPGYASRAARTIRACNAYLEARQKAAMVLTCRIEQYEALETADTWVHDAARIEINDVGMPAARSFLAARADDEERWKPVLEAMRRGGSPHLRKALSTPWRLTLAAAVYEQRDAAGEYLREPRALVSTELNTEEKVRDHLLELFIPAVAALHHGFYPDALAHRWLATLARYLRENAGTGTTGARTAAGRALSGTDLVLQDLWPLAGSRLPRATSIPVAVLAWAGLTAYVRTHDPFGINLPQALGETTPIFVILTSFLLLRKNAWPSPSRLALQRLRTRSGRRKVRGSFAAGFAAGLATGLVLWLAIVLLVMFGLGVTLVLTRVLAVGLAVGLVFGLVRGLVRALTAGLIETDFSPIGPRETLRSSIVSGLVRGLVFGLVSGSAVWLVFSQVFWSSFGLAEGLAIGFTAGLTLEPTGPRYVALLLCTRRWTGRWLPWRLGRFLNWCYNAGLLRVAGIGYQFRHRELQDYLANHPEAEILHPMELASD